MMYDNIYFDVDFFTVNWILYTHLQEEFWATQTTNSEIFMWLIYNLKIKTTIWNNIKRFTIIFTILVLITVMIMTNLTVSTFENV